MLKVVWETVSGELSFDAVAGPAHSGALRVATLDHKTGDDPMEDGAVVKTLPSEGDEIVHRIWSNFRIQLGFDNPFIGFNCDNGMLHSALSFH